MTNYRAILLYHSKGNNNKQVASICQCPRTTVIKVIKRAKEIGLSIPVSDKVTDKQLQDMLFPKRGRNTEYALPDFERIDWDKRKRGFTLYREWQKYCRICKRDGLKPYSKTQFFKLFKEYYNPEKVEKSEIMREFYVVEYFYDLWHRGHVYEKDFKRIADEFKEKFKHLRLDPLKMV